MTPFVTNQYGRLRQVLLCEPRYFEFMPSNETAKAHLSKGETADIERVRQEHRNLAAAFAEAGAQVTWVEPHEDMPYQVFTRDLGVTTSQGVLLGRFTYPFRRGEVDAAVSVIEEAVPVWKRIPERDGVRFEGGDFMYIDDVRAAVGVGSRTTPAGAQIVKEFMAEIGVEVTPVPIAPEYCHLDMLFNVVTERVCVACLDLLPEGFVSQLRAERWEIVETAPEDTLKLLGNLFAVDNGVVISPSHNTRINAALEALGIEVIKVELEETLKGGGGPHCMTFPLKRDPV